VTGKARFIFQAISTISERRHYWTEIARFATPPPAEARASGCSAMGHHFETIGPLGISVGS
jgi:hypothetical protein